MYRSCTYHVQIMYRSCTDHLGQIYAMFIKPTVAHGGGSRMELSKLSILIFDVTRFRGMYQMLDELDHDGRRGAG